jgi:hypothetical protein
MRCAHIVLCRSTYSAMKLSTSPVRRLMCFRDNTGWRANTQAEWQSKMAACQMIRYFEFEMTHGHCFVLFQISLPCFLSHMTQFFFYYVLFLKFIIQFNSNCSHRECEPFLETRWLLGDCEARRRSVRIWDDPSGYGSINI